MTDVFRLLQPFEWRGRRYPLTARQVTFQHENAPHKVQYRDGEFVDMTGATGFSFAYTIPMREDIAKGPYKNLFNEGLPVLLRDIRLRTPGQLIDPVLGEFRCVPQTFTDESDVQKRDGDDIRLEFKQAPEFAAADPAIRDNLTGINGLVSDAGQLDQALTKADWKQEPSPEGVTDILSQINGIGRLGLRQKNRLTGYLNDLAFKLEKIEDTADLVENPQNWKLRNDVRRMRDVVTQLNKRAAENPIRKFRRIVKNVATTVSALAAELDMTLEEFIALNPALVKLPMVPAGTKITAYAAKSV